MKAQTVEFRKYFTGVSGSVQTALFNSFLAFIFIITAFMVWPQIIRQISIGNQVL